MKIKYLFIVIFTLISVQLSDAQNRFGGKELAAEEEYAFDLMFTEGVRAKVLEDYKSALIYFNRCMEIYSGSAAVRYEMASIIFMLGIDIDMSLQLMREAVKINSNNVWYQLLLANIYHQKGMIDEACGVYNDLLRSDPEKEEYYFAQAELYISVEKWSNAIAVLNRYEKQFGISEMIIIEKSKLYVKQNEIKKAATELNKLVKNDPSNTDYQGLLAELYLDNNLEDKGIKLLKKILRKNPSNGFVQFYLTDYYFEKGDTLQGNRYLKDALLNSKSEPLFKVQYLLKLLANQDRFNVPENIIFNYVIELVDKYPDDLSVLTLYADLLKKNGQLEECKKQLEYIVSIDKNNYLVWEELLLLYNELEDINSLGVKGRECIKFFPDEPLPYAMIGISLLVNKHYLESIDYFSKGLSNSEENPAMKAQFYAYLGDSYYSLDSVQLAFDMFDKSLQIFPGNIGLLNNYAYYLSLRDERLDDAEKMSSMTIASEPDNPTFLDTYAWILFKKRDYSLAKFYITTAIDKSEDPSSVLLEHYGDILYMNGDRDEAVKVWRKALKNSAEKSKELELKIKNGIPLE